MNKMSRAAKPAPSKGRPMLAGLVFGVLLGLMMAGGVAWFVLTKNPNSFVSEAPHEKIKPVSDAPPTPVAKTAPNSGSAVGESKPQFEFYKVLTDGKPENAAKSDKASPGATGKIVNKEVALQAGAFQKPEDAEKLKAKLAMLGFEAQIQSANVPEKGLWYRVRLGPFSNPDEVEKAAATLRQNGMNATPVNVQ